MPRIYEKLEQIEHRLGLPNKVADLEWIGWQPNRMRITTWPPIDEEECHLFRADNCQSAPPVCTPPAYSRNVVDFSEAVTVFFFDQEEGVEGVEGVAGRVKTFDGRSQVPRCRITRADLDEYIDSMCITTRKSTWDELSWEDDQQCNRSRRRGYADHWEDLKVLFEQSSSSCPLDNMWLMENMPCDCDI